MGETLEDFQRFKEIFDNAPVGIFQTTLEGKFVDLNNELVRLFRYGSKEDIVNSIKDLATDLYDNPEDRMRVLKEIQDKKDISTFEIRFRCKDGSKIDTRMSIKPYYNNNTKLYYHIGIIEDITQKKRAERKLTEQQENMRYILKYNPNAIAVLDNNLRYLHVSNRYLVDYQISEHDIIGKHHYEVFPDIPERWRKIHAQVLSGEILRNEDDFFVRKDGHIVYNRWECRPWYDLNNHVGGIILYTEVMTDKKLVERALRTSQERYRELFEASQDAISVWQGKELIECNNKHLEIFGVKKDELYKIGHNKVFPEFQPNGINSNELAEQLIKLTLKGKSQHFDWLLKRPNGEKFYADITLTKVNIEGRDNAFMCIIRDVSERVKAARELNETKNLLQNILNTVPVAIFWKNEKSEYVGGNQYFLADAGLATAEDLNGMTDKDMPWKEKYQEMWEDDKMIYREKKSKLKYIDQINTAEDQIKWVLKSKVPLTNNYNENSGILGCYLDVTTLKNLQDELEDHREHLENLVEERTREIKQLNEELQASNEELFLINDKLKTKTFELEETIKKLKSARHQLLQSEKMASIGFLTAGIAHEINNPINFISSSLYGLEATINRILKVIKEYTIHCEDLPNCSRMLRLKEVERENKLENALKNLPELLKTMHSGVDRTTTIVKGLRTFSRLDSEEKSLANVNEILEAALIILHNKYKNRITIHRDYEEYPDLLCYPGKLSQVALNLIMNAIHAIQDKGEITVKSRLHHTEGFFEIAVVDTGEGITKENQRKIFDPFFTTKPVGEGTGIGLSIVHGIIEEHKGKIHVESEPGEGTAFIIQLPLK